MAKRICYQVVLLLLSTFILAACHNRQTITGNDAKQTVARNVASFQSIQLNGNYDVVLVGQMPQQVSLTADSNVLQYITTDVRDNTLYIDTAPNVALKTKEPPMLEIFVPTIKGISISGSGNINASKISADKLEITISGSGKFNVSGQASKMSITIAGAGEVSAQDLTVKDTKVDVSSAGQVSVNATGEINVKVSGTGLVEYYGSPSKVTQDISGSGRVIGISSNAQKNSN